MITSWENGFLNTWKPLKDASEQARNAFRVLESLILREIPLNSGVPKVKIYRKHRKQWSQSKRKHTF